MSNALDAELPSLELGPIARIRVRLARWLAAPAVDAAIRDAQREEIKRVAELRIERAEILANGELEMKLAESNEVIKSIALAAINIYDAAEAKNFVEMQLGFRAGPGMPHAPERFTITIRREMGKTPNELRMEAEAERDRLRTVLAGVRGLVRAADAEEQSAVAAAALGTALAALHAALDTPG